MKDYLAQAGNAAALPLAIDEHAAMIHALEGGVALKAVHGEALMSYGLVYDSAMELAFLLRFRGDESLAETYARDCDDARKAAAAIAPEDRQRIESVRLQYRLLGTRLPEVAVTRSLISAKAKPELPAGFGEGTVLVLFPTWCAQCRGMMKTLTEFARANTDTPLKAYGLMFHEEPQAVGQLKPTEDFKELLGTSTLMVAPETAQNLGVMDYPTAVVVDGTGMIRFIGLIPTDAFNGGGYIEKVIQRMVTARGKSVPLPKQ
jgi:thiol-disulfide isomerase/thioredoxin